MKFIIYSDFQSTATSLAKMFALYSGASVDGKTLVQNDKALAEAVSKAVEGEDVILARKTIFSKGGLMMHPDYPNAVYHTGFGGSMGWADTKLKLGFAYVTNGLAVDDEMDSRRWTLLQSIYKCLQSPSDTPVTSKL